MGLSKFFPTVRQHVTTWRNAALAIAVGATFAYSGAGCAADAASYPVPPQLYQALHWRSVGPFRGGRTSAVAGSPSQLNTFYIGTSGGGVWKTVDAGISWQNVSDGFFKVGGVGAIAVAPSDPDVIYVGTGESSVRNHTSSPGDGVYKSTDGGKTWAHLGLVKTRHIAAIVVDPHDADVVYVAAQGIPWVSSKQRGVYRSRDGGKTWQQVLFVNRTTGAHDLSINPKNPEVLYAAMWDHRRWPWHLRSGGPGSGLWKSVDGGDHWQRLRTGLPKLMGNTAVSVSPADPNRVYAMIEAEHGGVFRSDDAGKTWERVNDNHGLRARPWYYTRIHADPVEKNTVYVLGNPMGKSTDGGVTFTEVRAPHGDYHDMWINPHNNQIMVVGNDGGGTVTLDGGDTWSSEYNQPTGQFYRVFVDRGFPYRLYGGQQDRGTMSVPSRTLGRGIGLRDNYSVAGGESAHVSMDADHPTLVYATGILGAITQYNQRTEAVRGVEPYPLWPGFRQPKKMKYRFSWTPPVLVSQHHPKTVYMGAQMLLKTTDGGQTWHEASPDLTRDDESKQGTTTGPISVSGGGGYQTYGVITYITESPVAAGTLWVGSDDGLVHLTRDGGKHWTDVTPPEMNHAYVHAIEASPHDPARAYIAVNRYRFGDYEPLIYRTDDYGRSWQLIVNGIPEGDFVRVVREDPVRAGLLYAGTETGAYVSFNDGKVWQPLQLNLPAVPVTDLKIRNNDLVASTEGRGFWILDDVTPLRQLNSKVVQASMYLFKPSRTYRLDRHYGGGPGPFGHNPPNGVVVRYELKAPGAQSKPVVLEFLDQDGQVIRRFTSTPQVKHSKSTMVKGVRKLPPAPPVPAKAGMNSYVWNLRVAPYTLVSDVIHYVSQVPYRVAPGTYRVRLSYGGQSMTQSFTIVNDPRQPDHSADEWANQQELLAGLRSLVNEINMSANRMRSVAQQVDKRLRLAASKGQGHTSDIAKAGRALIARIARWEQQVPQPPLPNDVQDYVGVPSRLLTIPVLHLISSIDRNDPPVTAAAKTVAHKLRARWSDIKAEMREIERGPLAEFNARLRQAGVPSVEVPSRTKSPPPQVKAGITS